MNRANYLCIHAKITIKTRSPNCQAIIKSKLKISIVAIEYKIDNESTLGKITDMGNIFSSFLRCLYYEFYSAIFIQ